MQWQAAGPHLADTRVSDAVFLLSLEGCPDGHIQPMVRTSKVADPHSFMLTTEMLMPSMA